MSELAYSSAIAIADKIRRREISSREAVDFFLARVASLDKRINSVVTIDAARARAEADEADAALTRGEVRGPLHGVPMTIKDSFQTAGMRTTSGAPELAKFIPEEDQKTVTSPSFIADRFTIATTWPVISRTSLSPLVFNERVSV